MMRCSYCGTPNHPHARACYACARALWHRPPREDRTLQVALGILGGLFLLVVVLVLVAFFVVRSVIQRVAANASPPNPPRVVSPQPPPYRVGQRPRTYAPPIPQIEPAPSPQLPDVSERLQQDMERMRQVQERQRQQMEAHQREMLERQQRLLREHQARMERIGPRPAPMSPSPSFPPLPDPPAVPRPVHPEAAAEYLPLEDHLRSGVAIYQGTNNRRWGRVLAIDDNRVESDRMGATRRFRGILIAPAAGPPQWHDRDAFDFSNLYVRSDDPLIRFGR